jgi:hypothetical protein
MPSILEQAQERENAKLARAGLKPDGTPLNANADDQDDDRDDDTPDDDTPDDDNLSEIEQLRRDLAAISGRVAPVQRDADELRSRLTTEREAREREVRERDEQISALRQQLESTAKPIALSDLLSEDELKDIDPRLAELVMKMADGIAKQRAPKIDARAEALQVLDERERTRVTDHRQKVLTDPARGLHQLGTLAYDPKFIAWSNEDDNDVESVVNSLLNAKSTEEIDRYAKIVAKRIAAFKESLKSSRQTTDPKKSLADHMRRGAQPKLTSQEVNAKLAQAKNLARSHNPADRKKAQALLAELQ